MRDRVADEPQEKLRAAVHFPFFECRSRQLDVPFSRRSIAKPTISRFFRAESHLKVSLAMETYIESSSFLPLFLPTSIQPQRMLDLTELITGTSHRSCKVDFILHVTFTFYCAIRAD